MVSRHLSLSLSLLLASACNQGSAGQAPAPVNKSGEPTNPAAPSAQTAPTVPTAPSAPTVPPTAPVGTGESTGEPGGQSAGEKTALGRDVERICNAREWSGADNDPNANPQIAVANWIAANLESPEGKAFLVEIGPLMGNDKADRLVAEAAKHGLAGCPLADLWRE